MGTGGGHSMEHPFSATDETDARDIMGFAFRQNSGLGRLRADNLRVANNWSVAAGVDLVDQPCEYDPLTYRILESGALSLTYTGSVGATVRLLESADLVEWTEVESMVVNDCGDSSTIEVNLFDGVKFFRAE